MTLIDINKELSQNFLDFSYEANSQRAFADARDGLKPGQRACLWEMYSKGYSSNKPHVKSAKISGGTVASWWPHGTTAIYDTFARMSQPWINNMPEVDWHGANGSIQISGEPAADRYCVTGETLIKTNKGTLPIKELNNYADAQDNLKDIFIYDYLGNCVPATKFFDSGKHPVLEIILKNGQSITVTYNHPVIVFDKNNCSFIWKRADELTLEDKVVVPLFNYTQDEQQVDYTSGELEYKMLGSMISEGYITTQNRIGIGNTDIDLVTPVYEYFKTQIPELKAKIHYTSERGIYEFCLANEKYFKIFVKEYSYKDRAKDKILPSKILQASIINKSCFLRYLFEGDGSIVQTNGTSPSISYCSYSKELIKQLQILLIQDFNIFSRISSHQRKTGIEYKLTISGRGVTLWKQKIGFVSKRKNELLNKASRIIELNLMIANGSYYSTTEFTNFVRNRVQNSYCKNHAFSNYKNFYKCREYLDPFNYERLETLIKNYLFIQISSIESQGEQEVYSIRVDNPESDHSFIANGFINHNTEARLSKATEEGMLFGIKKNNVPMKLNFSEDQEWPEVLPAIYPRLLVNGCQGIGSTIANVFLPHSLDELAVSIKEYIQTGKINYSILAPSFPTGGIIINKDELEPIYRTGKGKVILRGKTEIIKNCIQITEMPYQVYVEPFVDQVKQLVSKEEINGIDNIINKSNKKQLLIEIECSNSPLNVLNQLFQKTDLQKTFNANQYALVGKTPKLLNYQQYLDIFLNHNYTCIQKEYTYDLEKSKKRLEIVLGLIKALEDIDNIIILIKKSDSSKSAVDNLIKQYNFTKNQAQAIVDMKLGRLAHLEVIELDKEKEDLTSTILDCEDVISNLERRQGIFLDRFNAFVKKYPNPRKTQLVQIKMPSSKEEKEIENVEPEKCVVISTASGSIKRIPTTSFKTQKRNGKGVKTQDDITDTIIRTNTIDSLLAFTNRGNVYRLLVNDIPEGTNTSKGQPITSLIEMLPGEKPTVIYSAYRDTDAEYIFFVTKNGLAKKTSLKEYTSIKKKNGTAAIKLKEDDEIAAVALIKDESVILTTSGGNCIHFDSKEIAAAGRVTQGMKAITMKDDEEVTGMVIVREPTDNLAVFMPNGVARQIPLKDFPKQKRAGKGIKIGEVADMTLVAPGDTLLVSGQKKNICIAANDIPVLGRMAQGNQIIKGDRIISVSKI